MPLIRPIRAVQYAGPPDGDVSSRIAPPYDVLDAATRRALLDRDPHNIVGIDLPHLPPKTVGPDRVYAEAAATYCRWRAGGVLVRRREPALFAYRQTFRTPSDGAGGARVGLIGAVELRPLGPAADGRGGVRPHERTFPAPTEDRLKLMRATRAQLSPIFGFHADADGSVRDLLEQAMQGGPEMHGTTDHDGVQHALWAIESPERIEPLCRAMVGRDIFIADGHHRYTTALQYHDALAAGTEPPPEGAGWCLFALVAIEDPGMVVLPTHRVLGDMPGYRFDRLVAAAAGRLNVRSLGPGLRGGDGDLLLALAGLERAVRDAGPHAIGLCDAAGGEMAVATPCDPDPLAEAFPGRHPSWRGLDVAIVQHLLVEQICRPRFCPPGGDVSWQYPHALQQVADLCRTKQWQLALVMQPTPLDAVQAVAEAGELMPPKSTFFYPKLATGLVINPLEDAVPGTSASW